MRGGYFPFASLLHGPIVTSTLCRFPNNPWTLNKLCLGLYSCSQVLSPFGHEGSHPSLSKCPPSTKSDCTHKAHFGSYGHRGAVTALSLLGLRLHLEKARCTVSILTVAVFPLLLFSFCPGPV